MKKKLIVILISIVAVICITLLYGKTLIECNRNDYGNKITSDNWVSGTYYSPLTFNKYNNILNSNDELSLIHIVYEKRYNPDIEGVPQNILQLTFQAGNLNIDAYFNSYNVFEGGLSLTQPIGDIYYQNIEFTSEEMNLIFNYLSAHNDYFFNNSEFEGLEIPYYNTRMPIGYDNYQFTLSISEPERQDDYRAWVISKDMDEPDSIMQGLIDILENNFINRFQPEP